MPGTTPRGYEYPLYTDTQNFPAQIQALAEDIDTDVQGLYDADTEARNAPTAKAQFAGLLDVPTGPQTTVTFNTELYDNAGMINLGVSPTVISIVETGLYLVTGWVLFSESAVSGAVALLLRSAGGLVPDIATVTKGAGSPDQQLSMVALTRCAAGESITLAVIQNTGSGLDLQFAELTVTKVAP